jgi:hypothetical protein
MIRLRLPSRSEASEPLVSSTLRVISHPPQFVKEKTK